MTHIIYAARLAGEGRLLSGHRYVHHPRIRDEWDYWRGLAVLWDGPRTVVNVEHDMEFSDALVADLLDCPHPLCTHAYRMYLPTEHYAHNVSLSGWHPPIDNISQYTARGICWIGPEDEWADFSAIGFCKIAPEARASSLRRDAWMGVELSVNAAVNCRWHVHWPEVAHYHTTND